MVDGSRKRVSRFDGIRMLIGRAVNVCNYLLDDASFARSLWWRVPTMDLADDFFSAEMDGSGASVSSAILLLAGCPYATLKMFLPFLFLPAVWFD